jgi:hypothetical protein
MTPIDWPASLPCFRFEPYQVAPRPGAIEFDMGMLTHRARIYTQNNEVVSVEMLLTSAEEQALRTFYKTTLSMGTQWFNVDIWRNSQQESVEALFFGAPPVFVPVAHNVVRVTFTLLTRDSGTAAAANPDPPDPVGEYDPIVLARSPAGYWPMRDSSPATTLIDISGNGLSLTYSGTGLVYAQSDLLTDPGGSLGNVGGTNFRIRVPLGTANTGPDPFTVAGWGYLDSAAIGTAYATLFLIGGSAGAAQIVKAQFYVDDDGSVRVFWHEQNSPNPATPHTATFATSSVPFDTPFYFSAGQKDSTADWFFKLNDQPVEYLSYAGNVPWQIPGRQTYLYVACQASGSTSGQLLGQFARFEYYESALTNLDMWTDWHL